MDGFLVVVGRVRLLNMPPGIPWNLCPITLRASRILADVITVTDVEMGGVSWMLQVGPVQSHEPCKADSLPKWEAAGEECHSPLLDLKMEEGEYKSMELVAFNKLGTRTGGPQSGNLKALNSSNNSNDKRHNVSLGDPRKECSLDDTDFSSERLCWTSDLQNCEIIPSRCFKQLSTWQSVTAVIANEYICTLMSELEEAANSSNERWKQIFTQRQYTNWRK